MEELLFQGLADQATELRERLVAHFRNRYAWEEVACVMCGDGSETEEALVKFGIPMRRCLSCQHLYVSPRLPEAAVLELHGSSYRDDYMRAIGSPTLSERARFDYENGFGKLRRDVLPYRKGGRLLDVGASSGGMVRAGRESGFSAQGIEASAEICELALAENGVELHCGDVTRSGLSSRSFEVITMHYVLEHVFEPALVLAECERLLAPSGILVVETPSTDSVDFAELGKEWDYVSPLEHLHLFSEANLAELVTRAGMQILDLYCPHENNQIVIAEVA